MTEAYHGLVAEFLDEAVENHGKRLSRDACPGHLPGIAIHARLPHSTRLPHGGDHLLGPTAVLIVVSSAAGDLDHDFGNMPIRLNLDVGHNAAPGRVDNVEEQEAETGIDSELQVVGQDRGEVGMGLYP